MSKSIIFDTETTGLNEEDKIIQVGAIIVEHKNSDYLKVYDELCSCEVPIKIEAMATHGIREQQLTGKPKFEETEFFNTLKELNNENNYLIAHNLDFDLGMLNKYDFENKFSLIDTLQCAMHLYEIGEEIDGYRLPNYKLQTFRYILLNLKNEDDEVENINKFSEQKIEIKAHDAIGDVVVLKLFFKKLVIRVMKKYKLTNYNEYMGKLVELTKQPATIKYLHFGKHKGKELVDIEKEDSSYIDWLFKEKTKEMKAGDFEPNMYYTLEEIIKNRENHKTATDTNGGLQF